ncbi:hypothetical protein NOK12_31110 [Nocardioides sp. OK12]|uniref:Uncharacterized protein n=1 Tax=Nocardioides marinisabuli TaxID=419476 RepID=A0A7Y9EZJ0_9ACTN|nr:MULTISPECIES: hypothetical protein [Nocardioides]NYD56863.1 hypothetical protein [Nocardioides marinisabuli]GHJ60593.1 hypothetical protein NOK12_31110 [Nocardioides sp. OK12]
MSKIRTATATLGAAALLATPLALLGGPAHADGPEQDRDFRVGGAEVDFSVEKEDGRFEVEVEVEDAEPGSRWRVVLKHDGRKVHSRVHRADGDGDVADIDKDRPDTKGADAFKLRVKKIGGGERSRTITMR